MPARRPLKIGDAFNRLTVVSEPVPVPRGKEGHFVYEVRARCKCGNEISVIEPSLRHGNTKSCGCLKREYAKSGDARRQHSMSKSATHRVWRGMIARCENMNSPAYKNYGARGIAVCERWKDFSKFLSDMGEIPHAKSIDRIDNNKGYEPGNCRWVTAAQQNVNTRVVKLVSLDGEMLSSNEAMRRLGYSPASLHDRMRDHACSRQEAIDYFAKRRKK